MNLSRIALCLPLLMHRAGCGPDRSLIMKTKLDAPLRREVAALQEGQTSEKLSILGKCVGMIDAPMREALVGAGAEVHTLGNDVFAATIPSDLILDVAALDIWVQLQLSQTSNPLPQ